MERNRKKKKVRVNFSEYVVCISRGLACGVPREGIVPRGGQTEWERNTRKGQENTTEWERNTRKDQERFVGGGSERAQGRITRKEMTIFCGKFTP